MGRHSDRPIGQPHRAGRTEDQACQTAPPRSTPACGIDRARGDKYREETEFFHSFVQVSCEINPTKHLTKTGLR